MATSIIPTFGESSAVGSLGKRGTVPRCPSRPAKLCHIVCGGGGGRNRDILICPLSNAIALARSVLGTLGHTGSRGAADIYQTAAESKPGKGKKKIFSLSSLERE